MPCLGADIDETAQAEHRVHQKRAKVLPAWSPSPCKASLARMIGVRRFAQKVADAVAGEFRQHRAIALATGFNA